MIVISSEPETVNSFLEREIPSCGTWGSRTQVPLDGSRYEFASRTGEHVLLIATAGADRIYVHEVAPVFSSFPAFARARESARTQERGDPAVAEPLQMDHVFSCDGDEARRTTTSRRGCSFDCVFRRLPPERP